jgi:1-acyl-sn-glycerol-3-phosphate acyltransferase
MENIGLPKSIRPRPYWIQYLSAYIVFFLGLFVGKIRVQGRRNIPKEGPIVLASNHFAYFDPFLLVYAIHRPIDFIMQKELGIEPHFLFAPMIYGAILTDRNKVGPSIVKQSLNTIKNGKILGIFPEGGITSPTLTEAKPGAVYLASIANATVLPVSVRGASNAWGNIFRGVRSRIHVNIGKPFGPFDIKGPKEEKSKKLEKASRELMCRIAALLPDEKHGEFSSDPSIPIYQKENGLQTI